MTITKKDLHDAIDEATADIISAVSKGFETTSTKEELNEVKEELDEVENEIKNFKEEVRIEFKEVKRQINDLKADTPTPQDFANHEKRISKLEAVIISS